MEVNFPKQHSLPRTDQMMGMLLDFSKLFALIVFLSSAQFGLGGKVADRVCQNRQERYYEELGCKPSKLGADGCPKSYDCSTTGARESGKCYYMGQAFDKGQRYDSSADCAHCQCDGRFFECAIVDCPDGFRPPPSGCYYTYQHDKCCSVGQVCLSDQTPEQKVSKPVCQYKSETYQLGQRIYQDEEPCLDCICQAGFNGSLVEPFCKKFSCKMELRKGRAISKGCAPIYYSENGCCPLAWRCPEKSDTAVPASSDKNDSRNVDPDLHCKFGGVVMNVGDKLSHSKSEPLAECTCRVPPHPICMYKE